MSPRAVYAVAIEFVEGGVSRADFVAWLPPHIAAVLACPGFRDARVLEDADGLVVEYELDGAAAMETYERDYAARLRAEGLERFGAGSFKASRRVLTRIL